MQVCGQSLCLESGCQGIEVSRAEPNHEGQCEHPEEFLNEDLPSYSTRT